MNGFPRRWAPRLVALTAVAVAGCSTTLDTLPLPAPGLGGQSYEVTATFTNALNLPAKAKVELDGAEIGQVERMEARDYTAVVTLRIRAEVRLPGATTAQLRSATPMGDVFVALTPPARPDPAAGELHDGSVIPVAATSAAATIEELLSRASLLVSGGALKNLTGLVNGLGEDVGGRGERLAALIDHTRRLLADLAARSDRIREVLGAAGDLTTTVAAQQGSIDDALGAAAPALQVVGDNTGRVLDLVGRIDSISRQLGQFPSIRGTNEHSLSASIDLLGRDLNDAATNPEANLDWLNTALATILKVTDASSAHVNVDIVQLALGAAPDPNFAGDPGARPPEATDWTNFVGSLEYNLGRLRGRLTGPGR
ncbi:Mce family protein MceE [Nocardia nova SH22a]|uniref:Mce family protein MceE n=1 Tax=Nocardia nova SH22a TaxID=1415166 RepID=W5TJG0_9NOCA|nr:MlaD family protein [Nocardia nova]AHH19475.1 Mce family protein MceE [Nocardia nova SH22a]